MAESDIVEFKKNDNEFVRVERTEYNRFDLLAVRIWLGKMGENGAIPTRKGITMRLELWRQILPAVQELLEE